MIRYFHLVLKALRLYSTQCQRVLFFIHNMNPSSKWDDPFQVFHEVSTREQGETLGHESCACSSSTSSFDPEKASTLSQNARVAYRRSSNLQPGKKKKIDIPTFLFLIRRLIDRRMHLEKLLSFWV